MSDLHELGQGWRPRVERVLESIATQLSEQSLAGRQAVAPDWSSLSRYLDLIVTWNRKLDLTAARDAGELVDLMLADSALLAQLAGRSGSWVDVGSGAGAPGLGLALLRADLELTLVEPLQKRVAFLRAVTGSVDLPRVEVKRARAQELGGRSWDVAVSRATFEPTEWLRQGDSLADELWLLLARAEPPQLEGWQAVLDVSYEWPLTAAARRAVKYARKIP